MPRVTISGLVLGILAGVAGTIAFQHLPRQSSGDHTKPVPSDVGVWSHQTPGEVTMSVDEFREETTVSASPVLLSCTDSSGTLVSMSLRDVRRGKNRDQFSKPEATFNIKARYGLWTGEEKMFLILDGNRSERRGSRGLADGACDAFCAPVSIDDLADIATATSARAKIELVEFQFTRESQLTIARFIHQLGPSAADDRIDKMLQNAAPGADQAPVGVVDGTDDEEAHYVPPRELTKVEKDALHKWFEKRRADRAAAREAK